MNILIYTYSVTRSAGGVFDAVRDLFTNEAFNKCHLEILSYKTDNVEDVSTWKDIPMTLMKSNYLLYSCDAKKILISSNADLLHMEALWRYPHLLMSIWKKRKHKSIVCSPHGMLDPYIIKSQGFVKRIIAKLCFQKGLESVTCFHALCQKEMEDIREYGLKQPVAIIPNGVDLPDGGKNYERPDNQKHLLYLGRLHKKKGVDLLLKAIAQIKQEHSELLHNWHIDIVGWNHENCQVILEQIVAENNLADYVTFHGGMFGEDKQRMYACADGYILPSHGEGLPMTVLEAWSWKVPVIMTPKCNIPEGFEHDAAVKIDDNVDSVKKGLTAFLMMSDRDRHDMGMRGYDLVKTHFTWDASAQKMIQLYEWLLGKGDKPDFVYI